LSDAAVPYIFINGEQLTSNKPVTLKANDRIIFGISSCFLFRNQDKKGEAKIQDTPEDPITQEFAMKEKMDNSDKAEALRKAEEKRLQDEETAKKLKEMNDKMEDERRVNSDMQKKMQAEYDAKMAALNKEINAKKDDEKA
jgi:hypothetical protein